MAKSTISLITGSAIITMNLIKLIVKFKTTIYKNFGKDHFVFA